MCDCMQSQSYGLTIRSMLNQLSRHLEYSNLVKMLPFIRHFRNGPILFNYYDNTNQHIKKWGNARVCPCLILICIVLGQLQMCIIKCLLENNVLQMIPKTAQRTGKKQVHSILKNMDTNLIKQASTKERNLYD